MVVQEIKINKIYPYENNPRKNAEAVDKVALSIENFGFKVPLVLDKNNVIICGHTRWLAAKKLNLATCPCIIADNLSDEQVKAFRLADNKTAEFAEWDDEKLLAEFAALDGFIPLLRQIGFEDEKEMEEDISIGDPEETNELTLQLTLCEEQYQICLGVIDFWNDKISHNFGNKNKKSNALFEAVYAYAKAENLIEEN